LAWHGGERISSRFVWGPIYGPLTGKEEKEILSENKRINKI
jgi:hypothetical protein